MLCRATGSSTAPINTTATTTTTAGTPDDRVGPEALSSILDSTGPAPWPASAPDVGRPGASRPSRWWRPHIGADLHRLPSPHPDDAEPAYGSVSDETSRLLDDGFDGADGMTWGRTPQSSGRDELGQSSAAGGPGEPGIEGVLRFLGEGAYLVSEFAVTELATTLELNEAGARNYLGRLDRSRPWHHRGPGGPHRPSTPTPVLHSGAPDAEDQSRVARSSSTCTCTSRPPARTASGPWSATAISVRSAAPRSNGG